MTNSYLKKFDARKGFGAIDHPFATTVDILNGSPFPASRRKLIDIDIHIAVTAFENSGSPHAF